MQRFYPLTAPFLSRLTRSDGLISQDVLQPEETEDVRPPYISDTCRDRVSGCHHWTTIAAELAQLDARTVTHAPVIRHTYGRGIVGPDGFATAKKRLNLEQGFPRNARTRPVTHQTEVTYINDVATKLYFGHWIKEGVSQTYLTDQGNYYLSNPPHWAHCAQYRDALGLRPSDDTYIIADRIITYSDFSQGSLKRARYQQMKSQIAAAMPAVTQTHEKVFMWRGNEGESRNFQAADQVRDRLEREGWKTLDVTLPLADIYQTLAGARLVAGMEGSHLNHLYFCIQPGIAQVVLAPHDRFNMMALGLSRAVGNSCSMCVLEGNKTDGYILDFDVFSKAVDHALADAPNAP